MGHKSKRAGYIIGGIVLGGLTVVAAGSVAKAWGSSGGGGGGGTGGGGGGGTAATISAPATEPAGGQLPVTGTGFVPGETVLVTLGGTAGVGAGPKADSQGNFSTTLNIPSVGYSGQQPLTAEGFNSHRTATITVQITTTPPTIDITSPLNNAQVNIGPVTFEGTASSGAGVQIVEMTIDGSLAAYKTATPKAPGDWSTWHIDYDIPAGSHYVVARVTDNVGAQAWHSITVLGGGTAPTLAITMPSQGASVPAGLTHFQGTASSGAGVRVVELSRDGDLASYLPATPVNPGDYTQWYISYNVPAGSHYFTARVTDNIGRQQWASVTVIGV